MWKGSGRNGLSRQRELRLTAPSFKKEVQILEKIIGAVIGLIAIIIGEVLKDDEDSDED